MFLISIFANITNYPILAVRCYRLAYAKYDVPNERLKIDVGPFRRHVPNTLNVWVRVGGKAALRFKGDVSFMFEYTSLKEI